MNEALKNLFLTLAPFNEQEMKDAAPFFTAESCEKGTYFSRAGKVSDKIGFVVKGLLRSFYDIKGKETTTFFQVPGSVAAALLSFLQEKPAIENIQALENSELIVISRNDLMHLYQENWKWQQVGRILIENYYVRMEQRLISMQSRTAQERYEQFCSDFPHLIQSVPQYYIASFLGMSPETLSRIRKSG